MTASTDITTAGNSANMYRTIVPNSNLPATMSQYSNSSIVGAAFQQTAENSLDIETLLVHKQAF